MLNNWKAKIGKEWLDFFGFWPFQLGYIKREILVKFIIEPI